MTDDGVVTALSDGTAVITVTSVARPDLQTTCEVIVKTRYSKAEVGQYIYADGNFGNDHSKAVARIIWKGNPGLTDGTLRADHPQCVHGVAVAMTIYGNDKFYGYLNSPGSAQSIIEKYEDLSQYEIQGYNNTKCLLECYREAAISNKNQTIPVFDNLSSHITPPSTSSGWYIPSRKEVELVVSTDAHTLSNYGYWISSMPNSSAVNATYYESGALKASSTDAKRYFYVFAF